jgi:hypothetical protein
VEDGHAEIVARQFSLQFSTQHSAQQNRQPQCCQGFSWNQSLAAALVLLGTENCFARFA